MPLSRTRRCGKETRKRFFAILSTVYPFVVTPLTNIGENAGGFDTRTFGEQSTNALGAAKTNK